MRILKSDFMIEDRRTNTVLVIITRCYVIVEIAGLKRFLHDYNYRGGKNCGARRTCELSDYNCGGRKTKALDDKNCRTVGLL